MTSVRASATALASLALLACGSSDTIRPGDIADAGPSMGNAACPPANDDVGLEVGQVIPNVELTTCDGLPVELHDVCPRKAAYFFVYADW